MKKYMGNKKEVLLFYLLMIAVIGWFVVAETVYPSEHIKDSGSENLAYRGTFTWERDQ
jgi:purine-cytosine permease-like protein